MTIQAETSKDSSSLNTPAKTTATRSKWENPLVVFADKNQAVSRRIDAILGAAEKNNFLAVLTSHLKPDRFKRSFSVTVRKNMKILECTPESVLSCIEEAASLGLEFGNILGHAYLVPYFNSKLKSYECTLLLGYRGMIDLARRYDNIELRTRCVYKGDEFDYAEGDDNYIRHKPSQDENALFVEKDITHVYLIAERGGIVIARSVWTRAQVERHKEQYSKGHTRSDSPWKTAWSQMARKTLVRESINRGEIPVSSQILRITAREEHAEVVSHVRSHIELDIPKDREIRFEDEPAQSQSEIIDAEYTPAEPAGDHFTNLLELINLQQTDEDVFSLTPDIQDAFDRQLVSEDQYNHLMRRIADRRKELGAKKEELF
jgi:recombination protein RecT